MQVDKEKLRGNKKRAKDERQELEELYRGIARPLGPGAPHDPCMYVRLEPADFINNRKS
jgi:hypothetical protein